MASDEEAKYWLLWGYRYRVNYRDRHGNECFTRHKTKEAAERVADDYRTSLDLSGVEIVELKLSN